MATNSLNSARRNGGAAGHQRRVAHLEPPRRAGTRSVPAVSDWQATGACQHQDGDEAPAFWRLTPRERDVAAAVGRGLTNQQVGWLMCISTKTVECHLSRIFLKLDIGSRCQLVAAFAPGESPAAMAWVAGCLTSRELEVATAAATGLTNRQVAEALFVSSRTVEFHLAKVYSKLGIRSRRQLSCAVGGNRATSSLQQSA